MRSLHLWEASPPHPSKSRFLLPQPTSTHTSLSLIFTAPSKHLSLIISILQMWYVFICLLVYYLHPPPPSPLPPPSSATQSFPLRCWLPDCGEEVASFQGLSRLCGRIKADVQHNAAGFGNAAVVCACLFGRDGSRNWGTFTFPFANVRNVQTCKNFHEFI